MFILVEEPLPVQQTAGQARLPAGRRGFIVCQFEFFYNNVTPSAFILTELIVK